MLSAGSWLQPNGKRKRRGIRGGKRSSDGIAKKKSAHPLRGQISADGSAQDAFNVTSQALTINASTACFSAAQHCTCSSLTSCSSTNFSIGAEASRVTAQLPSHAGHGCSMGLYSQEARLALEVTVRPPPQFTLPRWVLAYDMNILDQILRAELLAETAIGLDIEWKPTFLKGAPQSKTGLIQVSSHRVAVLLPVKHLPQLPSALIELLASPKIIKVGCGISGDVKRLAADFGVECNGVCDVGRVATQMQRKGVVFPNTPSDEPIGVGLKSLAAVFGATLEKPKAISRSNWEARPLTTRQQHYAALDAYAGLFIAASLHALQGTSTPMSAWLMQHGDATTVDAAAKKKRRH